MIFKDKVVVENMNSYGFGAPWKLVSDNFTYEPKIEERFIPSRNRKVIFIDPNQMKGIKLLVGPHQVPVNPVFMSD